MPILLRPRGHINCIPLDKGIQLSTGVAARALPVDMEALPNPWTRAFTAIMTKVLSRLSAWSLATLVPYRAPKIVTKPLFYNKNRVAASSNIAVLISDEETVVFSDYH
jgi:hypothetical protein